MAAAAPRAAHPPVGPASRRRRGPARTAPDGTETFVRRGLATDDIRLLLTADEFRRPDWTLEAEGVAACLPMLDVASE